MTLKTLLLFPLIIFQLMVFGQRSRHVHTLLGGSDTCSVTTGEKTYGGPGDEYATGIISTSDSGYLVLGYTNSFGNGGFDGYVVKLDKLGSVQWSKTYGGPSDDEFYQGRQTSDGGYILGGYTTSYGDPAGDAWLVRIDANGNLLWSKKYGDGNPNGERLFDVMQTADGGYAFCGDHKYTPGIVDGMVVRTDANGNLLWAKGFDSGGSDESSGITEDRDSLVVTAYYQSATGYDAVLMKLEETAGTISWLQSWDFDNRTNRLGYVYPLPDGYLLMGVNSDGYGATNPYHNAVKTDFNGNLIFVQELRTTPNTVNGYEYPTADGGYIVENEEYSTDPYPNIYMTKVQKDGSIDWSRQYVQPGQQIQGGVIPTPDGGYAGIAATNQGGSNFDLLLIKTDSAGQTNACTSMPISAFNRNPVVTNENFSWTTQYNISFNPSLSINPVVTAPATTDSSLCLSVNLCRHLQVTGVDSICDFRNPVSYNVIRDSGCVSPVQWSVDTTYAAIVTQTDSSIRLQYKQPGAVTIYGRINNTCGIVQDSLPIRVFHTSPIFLGNDTSFCAGGSVLLNASSGFQSYSWSTGDTTQQIVASAQGTYWVAAVNANSECLSTDTVSIGVYLLPVVNIGPDTSICRDSLYKFDPGTGFSSYLWQDGSADSVFSASTTGTFWVKVTDQNGCSASDTVRILSVQDNPKDFLEPTALICSRGQLPLQVSAIGTWARYQWSDGTTGSTTTISAPGIYWLQVSTAIGCSARDSVTIGGKACPLGIFFPNAFSPNNDGKNDVFRAIVYTQLDKFYLAIYNRWGVKVFETTDPSKGWDGTFNGQPQPGGAFVWYAQYQLQSGQGNVTLQRGTLVLIR